MYSQANNMVSWKVDPHYNRTCSCSTYRTSSWPTRRSKHAWMVTCLFLDLSKAFDCLNYSQFLKKLNTLCMYGKAACSKPNKRQLTTCWNMSCREQYFSQKMLSEQVRIKRGVPQVVLFILLTNDLPNQLSEYFQTTLYAEGTLTTVQQKSIEMLNWLVHNSQQNLIILFCGNKLALNKKILSKLSSPLSTKI